MDVSGLQQDHEEMESVIHDIREACRTRGELGGHAMAELRKLVFPHMLLEEDQASAARLRAAGFTPQEMHNMGQARGSCGVQARFTPQGSAHVVMLLIRFSNLGRHTGFSILIRT